MRLKSIIVSALVGGFIIAAMPMTAFASVTPVYDAITSPVPSNVPSLGFEATQTIEFGDRIILAGASGLNPKITVLMSSWGCENGGWTTNDCSTTPGSTFSHPITLNIYNVNPDASVGSLIATRTQTFNIPYRPSVDTINCTGGKWYDGANCYNGLANEINFDFSGLSSNLPSNIILGVRYSTSHYGNPAMGEQACFTESGGCGYDSLNVGVPVSQNVTTGTDYDKDSTYWGSTTFALDTGWGTSGTVNFRVTPTDTTAPTTPVVTGFTNPTLSCDAYTNIHSGTVVWTASTDASGIAGYDYFVDYPLVGGGRGQWTTFLTATEHSGALNEGYHAIKVRALDNAGNYSAWSSICGITTDWTAPNKPKHTYPKNDSKVKTHNFTFTWTTVTDPSSPVTYEWESSYSKNTVGNGGAFTTQLAFHSGLSSASVYSSSTPDGKYYWHVRSVDAAGNKSAWTSPWKVTVNTMPKDKDECKKDGWKVFNMFRNQGDCVSHVNHDDDDDNRDNRSNRWEY